MIACYVRFMRRAGEVMLILILSSITEAKVLLSTT